MAGSKTIRMALVGGGMFGGDVVLRTIEDLERCGVAPYLGRVGLDHRARLVSGVQLELVAIGTRTAATAERLSAAYRAKVPGAAPRCREAIELIFESKKGATRCAMERPSAKGRKT